MYATLICFIITSFIFLTFGKTFISFFDEREKYSFFDSFYIGLCFVGTILNIWSLFFPTNHYSLIFLLIISIFLFYRERKTDTLYIINIKNKIINNKSILFLITVILIVTLLLSVITPQLYDTYLYHINSIQWNENYKVVPGLANLHDRFGFNSSVFVISAAFSFNFIYEQSLFIINSLSFLFFFIWILKNIIEINNFKSVFLLLFIYYFTNQYLLDISSPGTDLLPNIFISYLLINILLFKEYLKKKWLVFLILPMFCITLKLSTLPIIILSLIVIFRKNNTYLDKIKKTLLFGVLFVLPWIIRNIILSGYLLFPVASIDIFNFDWKVPIENVKLTKDWIYSWARIPFEDSKKVLNMNFFEWFDIWWDKLLLVNKRFLILAMLSPFIFLINSLLKKNGKGKLIPIGIAFIIMLLWLFTAPDIRFSFSVILFLALSPITLIKLNSLKIFKAKYLLFFFSTYALFLIFKNTINLLDEEYGVKNIAEYYYLPTDVSLIKEKKNIKYNTKEFNSREKNIKIFEPNPTHSQCFDKFPCSWYIDSNIKLRGEDLGDGFLYIKK
jgi:hypothetical protein